MKKYCCILCLGVLFLSCKKGFLDRYPHTEISPQLYFNSESDLALYVNGLLDQPGTGLYASGSEQATDDYATTGNVTMKNILSGNISAQNAPNGWSWGRLRTINYFLQNYSKAQVAEDVKNHYAGLARYYRARFYLSKVKNYSDVPWYGETLNPTDSVLLYKASDPRTLIVDSILADMDFAIANVKEKAPGGTPGLWAVKAMYARMALFEGTYRKYHPELSLQNTAGKFLEIARTQAGDVMASKKFALSAAYADLFNSQDLSGNKEVLLNTVYDVNKGVSGSNNIGIGGNYEQSPSRDLVQTYLMKDGSRLTDHAGYQALQFVEEFKDRDPRIYATFMTPGFIKLPDTKPYIQELSASFTGYHQLKGYINSTDNIIVGSVDVPAIRYAEVLLIYAEAAAELGTITQDDLDNSIGLLRKRAWNSDTAPLLSMAAANANPDPVLMTKYPDVSGANKGLILEIRREKRVEFALEGQRYDDLLRWHAGREFARYAEGLYFPGLGQYDLTGDDIPDIILISKSATIPAEDAKIKNTLGVNLVYYKVGGYKEGGATIYLKNGESGGPVVTGVTPRTFIEPKYYYLPIPVLETNQNPRLKQPFGWE
ncbi:RagB/SusD family nutrient uptake outer membrane protein [Niabella aurantiaca]|uniref:RagB/SusD family nutrient uptake outer membrane protein n=1 Tax=Niabella aurantiaca TaxID=379900 RepID=UPI00036625A5|nr:RagB/SusD family nutrient uptake outer membrane protein [Niabella aurantiaca]